MEYLLFLLVVAVLIVLVNLKNDVSARLTTLQQQVDRLTKELVKQAGKESVSKAAAGVPIATPQKTALPQEKELPAPPEIVQPVRRSPTTITLPETISAGKQNAPIPKVVSPRKPGFFDRNPDLEKFIGENLANKIGIGILVLGIGFFVKYAIDQDWINEIGRVFIGIACGGILLGVAHRMRKTFTAFSSVLVGGGIAVLYVTIAIAFHEYQIFSQAAAFIIMVVITAFTILLSVSYNRVELAILAILGGFGSPFMVSTGEGNYVVLFTYILVLDVGMLVLAYFKKWKLVNTIAYAFTILLFGSWLSIRFTSESTGVIGGAMIFATLFYLVFFAMTVVNNLKERTPFRALEFLMLLSNTFLYYSAGMVILTNPFTESLRGLFTASVGVFNFIFAYTLYKKVKADRNLVFLLIGLVLTFITLAAPVQLKGNYITLFWAAETVLLLWLSQQSGIRLMKLASLIIMALMVISLVMDWSIIYQSDAVLQVVINKGYITSLFALASIGITFYLLRHEKQEARSSVQYYRMVLTLAGCATLYTSQWIELRHHLLDAIADEATRIIIIGVYNMLFILALIVADKKLVLPERVRSGLSWLGVVAILAYLFYYHGVIIEARNHYLAGGSSSLGFVFHYALITLLLVVASLSLRRIRRFMAFNAQTHNAYAWFFIFFFLFVASAELDHTVLLTSNATEETVPDVLIQNHKIGFPILWGVASFILIAIGLRRKLKHLRIISLTVLLITLLKLFLVDIRGISEGGKIAAFISLGVLLLVVSFMYQRLKKLLLADEPSGDQPNVSSE